MAKPFNPSPNQYPLFHLKRHAGQGPVRHFMYDASLLW